MFQELCFIERDDDGYIKLDSYLYEKYNRISIKNNPSIEIIDNLYIIEINNQKYYFKTCKKEDAIKEILADKMLEYIGFDHANYDLACINGEYGVISRNFKKDEYRYLSGDELIAQYYYAIDKDADSDNLCYDKYNNMTDIWDMLEVKYEYHPNKENIVKNIMYGLNEKFIFDIITCQRDGASYNWMIEENDMYARLAPIYDNETMLDGLSYDENKNTNIKVEEFNDERTEYRNLDELRKYLNYSSDYFVEQFKTAFNSLSPKNIKWLLITIEFNLNIKIDHKIKESILSRYNYNYQMINNVLNEELAKKR